MLTAVLPFPQILENPVSPKVFPHSYLFYLFDKINGRHTVISPKDDPENDPLKQPSLVSQDGL